MAEKNGQEIHKNWP
jgi:ABC-type multidrug transport system fused ATPase/permease subunit